MGFFGEFYWIFLEFFREDFFWEDLCGRIFLGGFLWEDFLGGFFRRIFLKDFFWRNFLEEIFLENFFGGFFWADFLGGLKKEGRRILILRSAIASTSHLKILILP